MGLFELVLVGFGLAMDAFAVAIGKGLNTRRIVPRQVLITGLWFGGFQALMPIVGYLLGCSFSSSVESIDHWIAFTLLAIIGLNMIREAIWGGEEHADADFGVRNMFLMAVATSIDALAVGVSIAFLASDIWVAALIIGVITFLMSALGVVIGHSIGARLGGMAALLGGIILIAIGTKILIEHLN